MVKSLQTPSLEMAGRVLLGLFFTVSAMGVANWVRKADAESLGLASSTWRNAPSASLIRQLPKNAPIYSNQIKFVYYLTDRTDLFTMPMKQNETAAQQPNSQLEKNTAQMCADLTANHGTLVVFKANLPSLRRFATVVELESLPCLQLSKETADAAFFVAAKQIPQQEKLR
jgi:hypothetical protein